MNTQNNTPASRNEEAVPCKRCHGKGFVEDGQLTHSAGGIPYENGPIQCVKDCPSCNGARKFFAAPGAAIGAREQEDHSTPGQWFVRKRERDGELLDCFVAAPDFLGLPYDAEILGDDEYRDGKSGDRDDGSGIRRKLADCELIVKAVTFYRAAQREALSPATVAQPVAWRLVPIEPTAAMIEAGASADPERESVWSAYLNAAPAQPCASQGCGGAAATVLSRADVDRIVYACRQSGDDSTYAIVNAALRAVLSTAKSGGGATPEGGEA